MRFWPERFDGRFPDIKDPRQFVFGFGRRCVVHDISQFLAADTLHCMEDYVLDVILL
jgi:hypothetical protein